MVSLFNTPVLQLCQTPNVEILTRCRYQVVHPGFPPSLSPRKRLQSSRQITVTSYNCKSRDKTPNWFRVHDIVENHDVATARAMVVTALDAAVFDGSGPSCPLAPAAEVASTRNATGSWRIWKSGTAGEECQNYVLTWVINQKFTSEILEQNKSGSVPWRSTEGLDVFMLSWNIFPNWFCWFWTHQKSGLVQVQQFFFNLLETENSPKLKNNSFHFKF